MASAGESSLLLQPSSGVESYKVRSHRKRSIISIAALSLVGIGLFVLINSGSKVSNEEQVTNLRIDDGKISVDPTVKEDIVPLFGSNAPKIVPAVIPTKATIPTKSPSSGLHKPTWKPTTKIPEKVVSKDTNNIDYIRENQPDREPGPYGMGGADHKVTKYGEIKADVTPDVEVMDVKEEKPPSPLDPLKDVTNIKGLYTFNNKYSF